MTVQREDIEPEEQRGRVTDWRQDPHFRPPSRVPWSSLRVDVMREWGRADPKDPQPEHFEILGPSGSGKTYLMCTLLQDRYKSRRSAATLVCTKPADGVIHKLGWPVVDDPAELRDTPNAVFWPRTRRMGTARRDYHEAKIRRLLHDLWKPGANRIVAFDEVGYVEGLSGEMKALIQQYWREARSQGITVMAMKQRPQGALRDMHSETYWTAAFPPKDRADVERFAELFGHRRDWMPVFDSLDPDRREFIIRHSRSREAYISWVDVPLEPIKPKRRGPAWLRAIRGQGDERLRFRHAQARQGEPPQHASPGFTWPTQSVHTIPFIFSEPSVNLTGIDLTWSPSLVPCRLLVGLPPSQQFIWGEQQRPAGPRATPVSRFWPYGSSRPCLVYGLARDSDTARELALANKFLHVCKHTGCTYHLGRGDGA